MNSQNPKRNVFSDLDPLSCISKPRGILLGPMEWASLPEISQQSAWAQTHVLGLESCHNLSLFPESISEQVEALLAEPN